MSDVVLHSVLPRPKPPRLAAPVRSEEPNLGLREALSRDDDVLPGLRLVEPEILEGRVLLVIHKHIIRGVGPHDVLEDLVGSVHIVQDDVVDSVLLLAPDHVPYVVQLGIDYLARGEVLHEKAVTFRAVGVREVGALAVRRRHSHRPDLEEIVSLSDDVLVEIHLLLGLHAPAPPAVHRVLFPADGAFVVEVVVDLPRHAYVLVGKPLSQLGVQLGLQ